MISSLQIERLEEQLQRNRNAFQVGVKVSVGVPVTERSLAVRPSIVPPRLVSTREIHGRRAVLTVVPTELIQLTLREAITQKLSVELMREDCGMQRWTAVFDKHPARITDDSLFTQAFRGRERHQTNLWEAFDPWLLTSGRPDDIRVRKAKGIRLA